MQRSAKPGNAGIEKLDRILGFLPKSNTKTNMAAIQFIYPNYL
jgi:hypothetical protein